MKTWAQLVDEILKALWQDDPVFATACGIHDFDHKLASLEPEAIEGHISTLKQFILSRVMPLPVYTEEDYKAAAKEMGGKGPKPVKKYNRETGNPRVRSLHHIDDEDFEDTREKAERRKKAEEELEEYERPKAPKTPTSTKEEIAAARMKMGRLEENKKRHEEEEEAASTDTPVDKVDSSDASDKADATDKTDTTETPDTSDKSDASDKTDADKQ